MSLRSHFTRRLVLAACLFALVACDPPTVATPASGAGAGGAFSLTYFYPHDKAVGVPADTSVAGTVTYDAPDYQATVVSSGGQWDAATEYKVTLKTGIKSKGGADTLDKEYSFGFTTK